jgi:hypothetical protein
VTVVQLLQSVALGAGRPDDILTGTFRQLRGFPSRTGDRRIVALNDALLPMTPNREKGDKYKDSDQRHKHTF